MSDVSDYGITLVEFFQALFQTKHLWQMPVIFASLIIAFGASTVLARQTLGNRYQEDLRGIVFALVATVTLDLFTRFFSQGRPAPIVHMALALTLALGLARIGVYILKHVFTMSARMLSLQTVFVRLVWIGFALHITGLLVPLLDILRDITFPVGGSTISLLQVVQAILVFSIMITLALWFGATIERQVMRTQSLDNNAKAIAIKLLKGLVLFFAVILTLPMVGIDSTFLSVLGGTLGVGLGFGLQKIASNYVSGFIILADRSVRLGDIITIDGKQGEVLKLEARCTTLKGGDGTLYVLPNETFMTQSLINHTQGGGGLYRTAKLQVLYGTDFAKVKALVEGVTKKQPQIMPVPEPALQLTQLGPHGLELLLEYWISDAKLPENQIRSQLLTGIYSALSESGIQMVVVDPVRGSTPLP
ncbi:MAG: hypothetical protein B7Z60_00630 [Ferrovum sp. 37-45-19]|uniref:mechanosensitive ion channel family protein n=1 Tax=Ferrovum sp. JA12 TaxID=1356299 RepID=UPI0007028A94|nr:mechanosensitive ion channel domain-containing protein [Ferrovum sp. JA12]OYV79863.1 MAG: hypothetical protein B7Z65_03920 [Ferrovum sp. 21-44-67]OYV95487.1 MAG: hypothetical protein B7Z60_00630 [Ferrovum sp. 37-45-19]HQT81283.1 mechanosensitive ion channel [Ferrovaceae bacterium]KRH78171.1 mechanosensitive channel MscK precursor [Ferrovum sp. JA12]HQU05736.1 mechanosensitive ion channel [Ferrovaceae bacterium]